MDKVILDGVEYLKASEAAKQFRYTSDYIGQLCRGKKVDARLVGRTWFVNPESLTNHKKRKYSKQKVSTKTTDASETKDESTPVHIAVESVLKNKTVKSMPVSSTELAREALQTTRRLRVDYESDNESLIPNIIKKVTQPPKIIRIQQAGAKKVRIGGKKDSFSFKPDELPEISLSGKLQVTPLPEPFGSDEESEKTSTDLKNIVKTDKKEDVKKAKNTSRIVRPKPTEFSSITKSKSSSKPTMLKKDSKKATVNSGKPTLNIQKKNPVKTELKFSPDSVGKVQPVKISTAVLISPLIATVLALVVVSILFSASSQVTVSQSSYESNVVLQVANLLEVLRK